MISYFAYARYMRKGNIVSTSHGLVTKKTNHSEPVSPAERRTEYHNYKKEANILFEDVKRFLNRKSNDYELFDCDSKPRKRFKTGIIQ